ncbi:MAG: hypothetical protein R3F34_05300 [Planctomycetota bacterium]
MSTNEPLDFDEDEDLFDFGAPSALDADDDIDIAEFLSSIDDSDASAVLDLAEEAGDADLALDAEEAAPAGAAAPAASKDVDADESASHEDEPAVAIAPVAAPAAVVAAGAAQGPLWRQPGTLLVVAIGGVLLLANVASSWFTWHQSRAVADEIDGARKALQLSVEGARREMSDQASRITTLTQNASTGLLGEESFETVEQLLSISDWGAARRVLFSKLALLDRIEPRLREPVEARALMLLARADHLQALENGAEVER